MSSSHFTNVKMLINKTTWSYCVTSGENMLISPLETQRHYENWMWNSQMYHVSRFWPSVTVLYITKMNPTSKNYFFFFLRCLKSFLRKTKFLLRFDYAKFHFSIWKCELQCKNWYETYIFYFTIVFVTPYSPQKNSPRVSIMTKKINKTLSFKTHLC